MGMVVMTLAVGIIRVTDLAAMAMEEVTVAGAVEVTLTTGAVQAAVEEMVQAVTRVEVAPVETVHE
jgi:hypothetical protein